MTVEPIERRTTIARLVRVRPDLLEIHYNAGCLFALPQIAETQLARREMMGAHPYATLSIIQEDVDFQLQAMNADHAGQDRSEGLIMATAVVCHANMFQMLVKIYFSYFPQLHRVRITDNEPEARAWLEEQLQEIARTGS
ncbi:MAG: hypothetical protein IPG69_03590 [Flavobacteriales bacterium]|nr:hypothetical protein [Flavobacteriales bacterium]